MNIETDGQQPAPEETAVEETAETSAEVETNESEAATDDGDEDTAQPEEGKKPAKGVQKRLDELTKRFRDAERDKERLLALLERSGTSPEVRQPTTPATRTDEPPREDQFEDYDAYQRALTRFEVLQDLRVEQEQVAAKSRRDAFLTKATAKYDDFNEVISDPSLPITTTMAEVIYDSEHGADIAYHLGTNAAEAARIAALPNHRQAIELGKLEAKFSSPKPGPKDPPPPPPRTVNGLAAGGVKDPGKMSMAEYVEARKAGSI